MGRPADTSVIVPAHNEALAIASVIGELRAVATWQEILVVDDASTDDTALRATAAGAIVLERPYNTGNGAAIKTGLRAARGEWILIIDGDGQHRPDDAVRLVEQLGRFDLVVGARAPATQASAARRLGNHVLNLLAGYLAERPIPDLTSGFRAARRQTLLEFVHLLPNGFSTPTATTLAFLRAGYSVKFEPVEARVRQGESKIRLARDGASFFLILLKVVTIFSPLRVFLPMSLLAFGAGVVYGLGNYFLQSRIPNGAVILLMFAVMVFLIGLVSEQIAALGFRAPTRGDR